MRREPGEKRFGSFFAETMRDPICRGKRGEAESRKQKWITRKQVERLEDLGRKLAPIRCEGLQQASPALAVAAENHFGVAEIALEYDGGAIAKGMRERRRRVNPLQAVFVQRERRKKWRAGCEGIDRGTKIMKVAGEC